MNDEGLRAAYAAELERYLAEGRSRSLLSEDDEHRLRVSFERVAADVRRPPASALPKLLLDAQDAGSLDRGAGPERAGERWELYEEIRQQTQDGMLEHI
jgi:hypothetical protein